MAAGAVILRLGRRQRASAPRPEAPPAPPLPAGAREPVAAVVIAGAARRPRRGGRATRQLAGVRPEGLAARVEPGVGLHRDPRSESRPADQVRPDRDRQDHEQEDEERLEDLEHAPGVQHHRHRDQRDAEGARLCRGVHPDVDVAEAHDADARHEAEEAAGDEEERGEDVEKHQSRPSQSVSLVRSM
jgi:hypothetical protein